jgi:hypothetical protein
MKHNFLRLLLICLIQLAIVSPALAYNFLYVDPETGEPYGWEPGTTIEYYLDPGDMGDIPNDGIHEMIKEAMRRWEAVPNANVPHFEFVGYLPEEVTVENYEKYIGFRCYTDLPDSCTSEYQIERKTVIILDPNDDILRNSFCRIVPCDSSAGASVTEGDLNKPGKILAGYFILGSGLFSGFAVDGAGVIVHEIGHMLGLAHPYINQQLRINESILNEMGGEQYVHLPSMTTYGEDKYRANIAPDDEAGIASLYPGSNFDSAFASISGHVLRSDGTPMPHANVIARNINDPWCLVYSALTDIECNSPSNELCYNSYDNLYHNIDGAFQIEGLPAGTYTIEVEGYHEWLEDYLFTVAPGIIYAQSQIEGIAEFWNEGDVANEDPHIHTTIEIGAGEIAEDIDIVLNGQAPVDDDETMIPSNLIPFPETTACVEDITDWAAIAGIEEQPPGTINADNGTGGGCSLTGF